MLSRVLYLCFGTWGAAYRPNNLDGAGYPHENLDDDDATDGWEVLTGRERSDQDDGRALMPEDVPTPSAMGGRTALFKSNGGMVVEPNTDGRGLESYEEITDQLDNPLRFAPRSVGADVSDSFEVVGRVTSESDEEPRIVDNIDSGPPSDLPLFQNPSVNFQGKTSEAKNLLGSVTSVSPGQIDDEPATSLETAVRACDARVVSMLLQDSSHGITSLRRDLAHGASKLFRLQRWADAAHHDPMETLRDSVPLSLQPLDAERDSVGERPSDWLLFYEIKIMHEFARASETHPSADVAVVNRLLAANGFDSFARGFSVSVISLCVCLGVFGLFVYVVTQVRLNGGVDAPVSLAHMILGAFVPTRIADTDFDPCRMRSRLPYLAVTTFHPAPVSLFSSLTVIRDCMLGSFSSWLLLLVRIPPEKDPQDEDYLSDDDESSRLQIREARALRARQVWGVEVVARVVLLLMVVWWLLVKTRRWGPVVILGTVYLFSSLVACAVAAHASAESEKAEPNSVAARVCAVFDVQCGARWVRSVTSTRSTARGAANLRKQRASRRRPRHHPRRGETEHAVSGGEHQSSEEPVMTIEDLLDPHLNSPWQEAFLEAGTTHTMLSEVMQGSIVAMLMTALALLWLVHLRHWAAGSFSEFYEDTTAAQMFAAYGPPYSPQRFRALFLEVAFFFLVGERIFSVNSVLRVTSLSLAQRLRALQFSSDRTPSRETPAGFASGTVKEQAVTAQKTVEVMEEFVRCSDFAVELSTLRWSLLRGPVCFAYLASLKVLLTMSLYWFLVASRICDVSAALPADPISIVVISVSLMWPLLATLILGAMCNREVELQCRRLQSYVDSVLDKLCAEENDDVLYVALRLKVTSAVQGRRLCWTGGWQLSFVEPTILVLLVGVVGTGCCFNF